MLNDLDVRPVIAGAYDNTGSGDHPTPRSFVIHEMPCEGVMSSPVYRSQFDFATVFT